MEYNINYNHEIRKYNRRKIYKGKESENKEVAIESPTIVTAVEFEEKNDKKAVSEELLVPQLQPIKGTVFSTNKYGEIKLGDIIGDGGEGTVYATQYPQIVAKVYHPDKNTISRKEKIEEMLKISIGSSNICWPIETLCVNGVFVGYIMPAANGKDMSKTVCKPAREGVKGFSNWKRRDLVNTCISVVNLFNELHKHNVFMGDVNPRNFIVNTSDDVFMVDTDSYQIGKRFLCPVGTELFTSPYMHTQMSEEKVGYANIPRSSKDELYALAVMLFLILFTGQPPFSMEGDGSFKSSIMDGNFPYRYKEHATENVPSGVWRYVWSNLDAEVKRLFYEAFVEKKYANEETWNRVLKSYLNNIDAGKSSNDIRPNVYKEIGDTFETISCEMCGSVFNEDKKLYEQRKAEGRPITLCKNCRAFIGLNQKIKYIQKCSECGEEYETTRLKNAEQIDKGYSSVCPECEKEKRSKSFYYRHQSTESVTNFQHYDKAYSLEGTEYKVSENRIFEESLALIEEKYYGFNFEDYKMDSLTDIIVEAEKGKPDYQYLLARKFLFSDNTELDLETVDYTKISESFLDRLVSDSIYSIENIGIEYLRKASEAGVAIATLLLGEYLMQYANDESSYHEVLNTLIPIATMGNSSAQNTIAYAYYKRGASDKARYWLGEAMETRNVQTCYNLFFINYPQLEHLSELIFSNSESPDTNLHRCVATGYYEACVVDICLREIYENNYAYGVASYVSALFPNDALFEAVKCIEEYKKDYQNNYRNINEIYSNFKKLADDGNGLAAYYCYLINMNEPGPFFASKEQQGRYLRIAQELLPQYSSAIENDDNFPKSYFMDMAMSLHKFSYYHSFWKEMCHKCVPDEIAERLKAELLERCQNSDLSSIYVNRELAKACEKSEPEKSISYLEKCVEMGDADALYDIGRLMYSNGDSKAVDYLEEAYKKGNVPAASLYGKIWINKELGCTSMNENASKAIHFACENDDADAYISLGKMYELGYFVEKNLNRALENYNIAISLSNGEKGKIERAFFYMFYTTFLGIDFRKHEGYLLDEYRGGNEAARSALEKFYDRFRPISDSEVKAIEHAYNDLGLLKYEPLMEKCKNYHKLVKRRIAKDKVKRAFAMIGKGIGFLILCAVGPAVVYLLSLMMYKFFADLIGIVIMTFVLLAFASEDTLPIWCLVIIGIVFVIGTIYVVGGIFTFIIAALAGFIIVSFISQFIN